MVDATLLMRARASSAERRQRTGAGETTMYYNDVPTSGTVRLHYPNT